MPTGRVTGFLAFAGLVVVGCVRLGLWQLDRLGERRAINARLGARLAAPAVTLPEALGDTASASYRRVRITGRYEYGRELVLAARSRQGSPGVNMVTPFLPAGGGGGVAILVNRGWVYSADGMSVVQAEWREPPGLDTVAEGHLETMGAAQGNVMIGRRTRTVRRLAADSLAHLFPWPIAGAVVVQSLADSVAEPRSHPWRLDAPRLTDGPHRSYAIQWFAFAAIGLAGMGAVLLRERPR